jgi:NAD(P)-dependent dehydrogenase (short-subunit alcohol dehydrogenase family)
VGLRTLKGRVAAVTGAAGGLGRALALELARHGAHLALADVDEAGLRDTALAAGQLGVRATVHRVDVADPSQVERFAAEAAGAHGAVHLLINNAGVALGGPFEAQSAENLDWILGINLGGTVHGCRAFLPHLRRAGEGHIVLISSVLGLFGAPGLAAYSASKAAVSGFGEALRRELQGTGLGVSVVYPGGLRTGIARRARWAGPDAPGRRAEATRFLDTRGLAPERAARRIVRAVRRGEGRVLIGHDARLADLLHRLCPGAASAFFAWRDRRATSSPAGSRR